MAIRAVGKGLRVAFRLRGVPVYFHWSTSWLVVFAFLMGARYGAPALVAGAAYLGVLLVHEVGHAEVARRLGYLAYRIDIYPFLGLCHYQAPRSRRDAAVVAWGGVLAQAAVLVFCMLVRALCGHTSIASVNVLVVFGIYLNAVTIPINLVPYAPLDGHLAWSLFREAVLIADRAALPDLLGRTREERGDGVLYRFANGLTIRTERFGKPDPLRILPLGSPQGALMNHLASFPERVRDRRVLEPFAGSGALGLMALALGARHVDLLDINPRAAEFQRASAELSGLENARCAAITGDIADFAPAHRYDLVLANPPFVPTPDGIAGSITSNGGPDGSRFADLLFGRLEELLDPRGEALVYLLELVQQAEPLAMQRIRARVERRPVELTPAQTEPTPLAAYRAAYAAVFPDATDAIGRWAAGLAARHGPELALRHYIAHVGPRTAAPTSCVVRENFAQKFGAAWLVPSQAQDQLAAARVLENVVPLSSSTTP